MKPSFTPNISIEHFSLSFLRVDTEKYVYKSLLSQSEGQKQIHTFFVWIFSIWFILTKQDLVFCLTMGKIKSIESLQPSFILAKTKDSWSRYFVCLVLIKERQYLYYVILNTGRSCISVIFRGLNFIHSFKNLKIWMKI